MKVLKILLKVIIVLIVIALLFYYGVILLARILFPETYEESKKKEFQYMNGYSSTDFKDYMVYSKKSKLATLDKPSSLVIDNEIAMPRLDGAEACYPLYASFAKAVYKDIDIIEKNYLDNNKYVDCNGKIVTFTNTISGFKRLLSARNSEYVNKLENVNIYFGSIPSKKQLAEANLTGVDLTITPVAKEAFVFFVEKDNPIDNLTQEEFKAIYHGDITNWKELGGKDQKIVAYQRPEDSGAQTVMENFMGDVTLMEPIKEERITSMGMSIDVVSNYKSENGAIGYSFRYFVEDLNKNNKVKILSIDGVYPSIETIENGTYPLTTDVCAITRTNEENPYVQKMIDFIISQDGQELVYKTGYGRINEMDFRRVTKIEANKLKQIRLKIGAIDYPVEFENNEATRALYDRLLIEDVKVILKDYGSFEKVGELGFDLPREDKKIATKPGDIMLYDGNKISLFYDTNEWNYTLLGRVLLNSGEKFENVLSGEEVKIKLYLNNK